MSARAALPVRGRSVRSRVVAGVAGATLTVLAVLAPATPAMADDSLTVNVDQPAVDGGQATVSGSAAMSDPLGLSLDKVTAVSINVTPRRHGGPSPSCNGCGASLGESSVSFSFTTPDLAYNGPYDVTVNVAGRKILLGPVVNSAPASTGTTLAFNVEVDPAPPANVTAVANPDRSVTVSWSRNSEPDLVGYQVQRRGPGGSAFLPVGSAVSQPADGSTVQWTDTSTAPTGGQFEYLIVAVRPDGDGQVSDRATSASTGYTVSVPVPPGAPGGPGGPVGPGGPAPGGPGGIATTGPGGAFTTGSPSSLDLSSFIAAGGAPPEVSVPGGVQLPDGTFSESLPFGSKNDSDAMGSGSVEILGHSTSRRTLLLPIATGLLLCLLALHLRRLNRRLFTPSLET